MTFYFAGQGQDEMKNRMRFGFGRTVLFLAAFIVFAGCSTKGNKAVQSSVISDSTGASAFFTGRVSYLGPEGTYTQEAAQKFFGDDVDFQAKKTVSEAVLALSDGRCDFAVIPVENTIGGPVYDYLDELLKYEKLCVQGEVELPIRQALLAPEGTSLSDIKTVYSHKQGIIQGKDWLEKNVPDAQVVEVSSTAKGAEIVSKNGGKNCAAIASAAAAGVYGLTVLHENIQQNEDNKTRFYVLSSKNPFTERSQRMLFIAEGSAQSLPELTAALSKNRLILVSIHARPSKTTLGRYKYIVECENAGYEEFRRISAADGFTFRYAGSFCVK